MHRLKLTIITNKIINNKDTVNESTLFMGLVIANVTIQCLFCYWCLFFCFHCRPTNTCKVIFPHLLIINKFFILEENKNVTSEHQATVSLPGICTSSGEVLSIMLFNQNEIEFYLKKKKTRERYYSDSTSKPMGCKLRQPK